MAGMGGDLHYGRTDLLTVASCNRGCTRVLPKTEGKQKKQKLAVADQTGLLQVFQMDAKTQDLKHVYKAPSSSGKAISRIDLVDEKVFVASGDTVRAFTKKGREFFKVETNLAEQIQSMAVKTPYIWTAGEYVVACFEEGVECAYLNTPDRVNDLIIEAPAGGGDKQLDAIIGCQDRMLRVVRSKEIIANEPCEGGVLTVRGYTQAAKDGPSREIHYGTDNGILGSYKWTQGGMQKKWTLQNNEKLGGVTALQTCDLTGDGVRNLIVGRDDGHIEVFGFDMGSSSEPQCLWKTTVNESIQSLEVGGVTRAQDEIIASTYTGKILSYQQEAHTDDVPVKVPGAAVPAQQRAAPAKKAASAVNAERRKKIAGMNEEIEKLKQKLDLKRDEYGKMSDEMVAVTVKHNIKDKFVLDAGAAWTLTIELDSPIDTVALQSDVEIELLDTESSTCIVSTSKPYDSDKRTKLLACYRCTESTSRMEMKVRTVEGTHGTLRAYIIPYLSPKTCQMATYKIKPLSLHQRLNETIKMPDECCILKVDGQFSINDMHSWISECLPEVPTMLHEQSACYTFRSTFQGTVLKCSYKGGEGQMVSDNISALMVLWDYITMTATSRKIKVNVTMDTAHIDASCKRVLQLLDEKLSYQLGLCGKHQLIEALKEIEMQEQDISFLAKEYKDVIDNAREIEKEYKMQPRRLEFLHGIVKKLYLDKHKPKGQNPTNKIPQLESKLKENYKLEDLQDFFCHS